jgi:hypothetical protein
VYFMAIVLQLNCSGCEGELQHSPLNHFQKLGSSGFPVLLAKPTHFFKITDENVSSSLHRFVI